MDSFDVYFFYRCIRLNSCELYRATVVKNEEREGYINYSVVIYDRILKRTFGPVLLNKKHDEWLLDYSGDVDLFNLKIEISRSIEIYESQLNEHLVE